MALRAVKVGESFADTVEEITAEAAPEKRRERYDLATAIAVVREMETSIGRANVFEEIKKKNTLYRLVDTIYAKSGARFFQPLFLFLYMVKCVVSLGPSRVDDAEALAISNFDNEHKTIDRVAALAPDVRLVRLTVARSHLFFFAAWTSAWRMVGSITRLWSFLRLLTRAHSFMPAARIASAVAFYIRCSQYFAGHKGLKAAIVASNYSPEAVGMAAAAHRHGRRVVYSNHAPVPANGTVVPPVLADCALFYGSETTQTYKRRAPNKPERRLT